MQGLTPIVHADFVGISRVEEILPSFVSTQLGYIAKTHGIYEK